MPDVQAALQRERHRPGKIAAHIGVGGPPQVVDVQRGAACVGHRVAAQVIRIHRSAGGAIGHRNHLRPPFGDAVERHRHAGALDVGRRKLPDVHVLETRIRPAVPHAGLRLPHRAVVIPAERRHVVVGVRHASVGGDRDAARAGEAARRCGAEAAGQDTVDVELQHAALDVDVEGAVLKREVEPVAGGDLPVHAAAEGIAPAVFPGIADRELRHIGPIERGRGERAAVGRGAHAAPEILVVPLAAILLRAAARQRVPKILVHRLDVGEIKAGMNLARGVVARTGGGVEGALVVAHEDVGAQVELRTGARKRAARDEVHRTGEGRAGRFRRRRMQDLDAREVVEGHRIQFHGTIVAVARGETAGARHVEAPDRHGHAAGRRAVDRDFARVAAAILDVDARHQLQELPDAALGHTAEFVGRGDVPDIRRVALLVDRDRRGVHLLRGSHDKVRKPDGVVRGEVDVMHHGRTGGDGHGAGMLGQPGERGPDRGGAGGNVGEPILAVRIGEGLQPGVFDGDAGVLQKFSAAWVEDATRERTGGGLGVSRQAEGQPPGGHQHQVKRTTTEGAQEDHMGKKPPMDPR